MMDENRLNKWSDEIITKIENMNKKIDKCNVTEIMIQLLIKKLVLETEFDMVNSILNG